MTVTGHEGGCASNIIDLINGNILDSTHISHCNILTSPTSEAITESNEQESYKDSKTFKNSKLKSSNGSKRPRPSTSSEFEVENDTFSRRKFRKFIKRSKTDSNDIPFHHNHDHNNNNSNINSRNRLTSGFSLRRKNISRDNPVSLPLCDSTDSDSWQENIFDKENSFKGSLCNDASTFPTSTSGEFISEYSNGKQHGNHNFKTLHKVFKKASNACNRILIREQDMSPKSFETGKLVEALDTAELAKAEKFNFNFNNNSELSVEEENGRGKDYKEFQENESKVENINEEIENSFDNKRRSLSCFNHFREDDLDDIFTSLRNEGDKMTLFKSFPQDSFNFNRRLSFHMDDARNGNDNVENKSENSGKLFEEAIGSVGSSAISLNDQEEEEEEEEELYNDEPKLETTQEEGQYLSPFLDTESFKPLDKTNTYSPIESVDISLGSLDVGEYRNANLLNILKKAIHNVNSKTVANKDEETFKGKGMGNENKIASGNGNGNEPGSGNASGCSLIEPFSPISINIPAFRKKEIDISYIVSEFSQGTINEEDLEYLIEIQSPNPNPNPNRYSPSYQAPPSSSLPPPPLSNIQVHNNQHKCKIRFGEKAELLLYDGNESCTSILPAKKNNQNELEKIESTSNLSANITFCVDDYKKIHRSNSFFSDSIGRRISRSLSKLSLSSQDKEKKKDKDKETEVGTEVETETDMNLVEAESEDDQISKSNYQQHQQSSNQQSFHQQFQQRPILKNKINDNSEQENIRAQKCDEVDFNSFMNFFEEHERRRMVFEPCLGQAREEQLLKYYNTMSPSPELACPFNNEESSDVSSNNYYI